MPAGHEKACICLSSPHRKRPDGRTPHRTSQARDETGIRGFGKSETSEKHYVCRMFWRPIILQLPWPGGWWKESGDATVAVAWQLCVPWPETGRGTGQAMEGGWHAGGSWAGVGHYKWGDIPRSLAFPRTETRTSDSMFRGVWPPVTIAGANCARTGGFLVASVGTVHNSLATFLICEELHTRPP